MIDPEPRPALDPRDAEPSGGLAHAAMFRELDRALDEVRLGLAVSAWGRRASRAARRDVEPS